MIRNQLEIIIINFNFWPRTRKMMKKSTLSTRSKAFVSSNTESFKFLRKERKSLDENSESPENPMVIGNFADCYSNQLPRNKSNKNRDDERSQHGSTKSASTSTSIRNVANSDSCSDSSDDLSEAWIILSPWGRDPKAQPSIQFQSFAADSSAAEKKKTRRAGRKHKAQTKSTPEETSNSDKEKVKYKTELCKNWLEKGKCSYSVRCRFAHGPHELVQAPVEKPVDDYKKKPCVGFLENSYCPYGVRCLFIHEERKMADLTNSYFSKSLMLDEETRKTLSRKRLGVFASLPCCSD